MTTQASQTADNERPRPRKLAPLLDVIPESCYDNPTWLGLAYWLRDLAMYSTAMVLLALTDVWWHLLLLYIFTGLVIVGMFVFAHDAGHGVLFKKKWLNELTGIVAMLPTLHIFAAWKLGHNRIHHGHTNRQTLDFPWHPVTLEEYQGMSRAARLRTRLEWSWLGAGAYYVRKIWWNSMVRLPANKKSVKALRRDQAIVALFVLAATAGLITGGWYLHGTAMGAVWLWLKLFVIPFYLACHIIGFSVYVHHIAPDIPWHKRRKWTKFAGQVEGTTTFRLPFWLNFFYKNIFEHVAHHVDMRIPFYHLRRVSDAIEHHYPELVEARPLSIRYYLATTARCKLYDFDAQQWLPDYPARVPMTDTAGELNAAIQPAASQPSHGE